MYAQPGDWLIVKTHGGDGTTRTAVILAVHDGGTPPYQVRWTDNEHEGLVFPGPDAVVLTPSELAEQHRTAESRMARTQHR